MFEGFFDPIIMSGLFALEISIVMLLFLEAPIHWFRLVFNANFIDALLEKRYGSKPLDKAMDLAEGAWLLFQLIGWNYLNWVERKSVGSGAVDRLLLDSVLDESGAIMTCDDSGKVFIGFVLSLPDPEQSVEERAITIAPIMSGALCKDFQQLHITTDYSDSFSQYLSGLDTEDELDPADVAVVIYTRKIKILRKFDIGMFDNFFKRRVCPCGHEIYLPRPHRQNVFIAIDSKL